MDFPHEKSQNYIPLLFIYHILGIYKQKRQHATTNLIYIWLFSNMSPHHESQNRDGGTCTNLWVMVSILTQVGQKLTLVLQWYEFKPPSCLISNPWFEIIPLRDGGTWPK